jgi:hypothetical protein
VQVLTFDERGELQVVWQRRTEQAPFTDAQGRAYVLTHWYGMPVAERQVDGEPLRILGPWWLWPVTFPVPALPLLAACVLTFLVVVNAPLDDRLIKAAAAGNLAEVRRLLPVKTSARWSPFTGKFALGEAARSGHAEVVRLLATAGEPLERRDDLGRTALILAAENGHAAVVRTLLDVGAPIDPTDRMGWDAAQAALENGHLGTVELLRTAGKVG